MLARWWRPLPYRNAVTMLFGVTLVWGCDPGDDDDTTAPADDDTTAPADDDDTGDDDSADDDSYDDPCALDGEWLDLLDEPDPENDASGYLLDIEGYSVSLDGSTIALRVQAHEPFSGFDPDLMIDMFLSDGEVAYTLTWDNQRPNPGPLQLWSDSNSWTEPLASPDSLCGIGDGEAMVLGVDLVDLGLGDVSELETWVGVDLYSGYLDEAPDGAFGYGIHAVVVVVQEPDLALATVTLDDTPAGNGDGVLDPGETVSLTVQLDNVGNGATGTDLTGTLALHAGSTAAAQLAAPDQLFVEGAPLEAQQSATATYEVTVDAGATAGQVVRFDLAVADADGGTWSLATGSIPVGLAPLGTDPVDLAATFDAAAFYYGVQGDDLLLAVVSHSDHDADQEVDVFLDADLDGSYDLAVSTIDTVSDTFIGGVFAWEGAWVQTSQPTRFEFDPASDFLVVGVPIVELGNLVQARAYVVVKDVTEVYSDFVPDDPAVTEDLAELAVAVAPYIVVDGVAPVEVVGDGDLFLDAGEQWTVELTVLNLGTADGVAVTGELTSAVPELAVSDGSMDFGAVTMGATAAGVPAPTLTIDPGAPASGSFDLDLAVVADGRSYPLTVRIALGILPADLATDAAVIPVAATLQGDTTELSDDYQSPTACTQYSAIGHDGVYAVELTTGQVLDLDLQYEPGAADAVLYLSDDPLEPDLQCLAGADSETGSHEDLSYTAPADGTYYVVVDAFGDGFGAFSLEVAF